jgi:hypothetical protein
MTYAHKIDTNQPGIVQALRKIGVSVETLARVGGGCPDLLCGYKGHNYLLEVKTDSGKLTPDQIKWDRTWNGRMFIVRSIDEAVGVFIDKAVDNW